MRWTYRPDEGFASGRYRIVATRTAYGIGWMIMRDGREASALIFKHPVDARRLAEWDAGVRKQVQRK